MDEGLRKDVLDAKMVKEMREMLRGSDRYVMRAKIKASCR